MLAQAFLTPIFVLIITHKFLEPPAERIAKAEIIRGLFNTTWLVTMARKSVPKDVGNDKTLWGGSLMVLYSSLLCLLVR